MDLGERVIVYADKGFHNTKIKTFEAVGNVIISLAKNTIYGAKATLNFKKKLITVKGNVRFIGSYNTFYGVELSYYLKSKKMILNNARILSDSFIILGKKIIKENDGIVYADDAEYTTCKDCPESWSIFGDKVKLVKDQYIYITNAFIKMKGIVIMYFPYIVFPIKKDRESGLLFPTFGVDAEDGSRFIQPWFWAINEHSDLTFAPAKWGKRGFGMDWQYRFKYENNKWIELNSMLSKDKTYDPLKNNFTQTKGNQLRHISNFEYNLGSKSDFNFHTHYQMVEDSDVFRDFEYIAKEKLLGPETGMSSFLEYRFNKFNLTAESYYMKNILFSDSYKLDKRYVQILPKLTLSSSPFVLVERKSNFLNRISFTLSTDFTQFKQLQENESQVSTNLIRNASRLNLSPDMTINWGNIYNLTIESNILLDAQSYYFPHQKDKKFSKGAIVYESSASLKYFKIFGDTRYESKNINTLEKSVFSKESADIIGTIPNNNTDDKKTIIIKKSSYRHDQEWKLVHRYIDNLKTTGNKKFMSQISDESGDGLFDRLDAFRDIQDRINSQTTRTLIPKKNSIELQWNNILTKKSPVGFKNFVYSNIVSFNVSQGFILDNNIKKFKDKLTRLAVKSSIVLNPVTFSFSDYYFYDQGLHLFSTGFSLTKKRFRFSSSFSHDPFSSPVTRQLNFDLSVKLNKNFTVGNYLDYDIEKQIINKNTYSLLLNPDNNCWMLDISYTRSLTKDKDISVNFLINFNDNNYKALTK